MIPTPTLNKHENPPPNYTEESNMDEGLDRCSLSAESSRFGGGADAE
jgi:hypothetical protein